MPTFPPLQRKDPFSLRTRLNTAEVDIAARSTLPVSLRPVRLGDSRLEASLVHFLQTRNRCQVSPLHPVRARKKYRTRASNT